MEAGNHSFTYKYVVIDKKLWLPVFTRENSAGVLEKGGYVIGRVSMFKEEQYYNHRVDQKIKPGVFEFSKAGFGLKNSTMLADGSMAPALTVMSLNNQVVPSSEFANKLYLVEFGATDCPANALANPMLNNLYQKYASKQFAIACIYTGESAAQLTKYATANNIKFPMYLGSRKLKQDFKTIAVPNFYLVDKDGRVIKSFNGYSDDLERELSLLIESKTK